MIDCLNDDRRDDSIPLVPLPVDDFAEWLETQSPALQRWTESSAFKAKPGSVCLVPGSDGELERVLAGIADAEEPFSLGGLATSLPPRHYHLEADWDTDTVERATLGWALGGYRYSNYRSETTATATLAVDDACDAPRVRAQAEAICLVRDLINTPPEDMMPEHLADAATRLAEDFGATLEQITGDALLDKNYPAIHAVGRASIHAPRLIDLCWGDEKHPGLTLVGKGVCFDSGGLDIKSAAGMRLMKKDMGGAAHALGLAHMIMSAGLPVRLRVLVAAVENAISGNAYRPGDVVSSRRGITIEIHNTDAEGRVVLCDALAEAADDNPALIVDFATLTGAARIALGTEIPAMFANDDEVAEAVLTAASEERDPVWRLPLYTPYRQLIDSRIADISNAASTSYGGALTAALFLAEFVPDKQPWLHFDVMAWNTRTLPGRPEGGEAMGLRALFAYLNRRFAV